MNLILIVSDTFRRDHLGCYGNDWIRTSNIDKLAEESVVFDGAYTASFPTVPHRRDLVTGRYTFTYSDWEPLPLDEVVMADLLREAGYVTMLITDTANLLRKGYHFDRGFDGWLWIRGQEHDRYMTDPVDVELPCAPHKLRMGGEGLKQHLRNVSRRRYECDYFVASTMIEAARWLERNRRHEKFFLHVDTFDPHEPWDPPRWYVDLYDPGYEGEEVTHPAYRRCDYLTPEELKHVRALYAGEVTMVDHWVGYLIERVKELGLWDDTAIVFTTDHGFYHGEHGLIGKSIITETAQGLVPLYSEVAHIPLMIRVPGVRPGRRDALVQPPDLMPTILDVAGAETPDTVQGKSLLPLVEGKDQPLRDLCVSSPSIIHGPVAGQRISAVTEEWFLVYCGQVDEALRDREEWSPGWVKDTIRIVDGFERLQKIMGEKPKTELYHLPEDPRQLHDVFDENRDFAEEIHGKLVGFLESLGTDERVLKYWRRLT